MTQQKRIDKILQAVKTRVQEEVGALLGTDFFLTSESYERVSKEDIFAALQGKQICAEMDITGEISGKACLLAGIKDAIRLGGTLIMLPESELGEVIGREEYSEEVEDSYGEIANIIAGSFTKDFEEMYPKSCRFVRKNQEKIVPAKVEIDSTEPVENVQLYRSSWAMSLDGTSMGNLIMLLPAKTFELEEAVTKPVQPPAEEKAETTSNTNVADAVKETVAQPDAVPVAKIDFEKQKKRVDRLLNECQSRLQNEIGGLLGVTAVLTDIRNYFVRKEEFFEDRVSGRQIIADMEVVGDAEGKSFFCASIKDAVHLGGVLIMLPPNELEITVNEEDFGADAQDAYGEITNIVSGVYTAVFEEQYTKKLRFIKKGLTEVQPAQVDTASAEPIPDVLYYVNSLALNVDGKQLGKVQMLFPAPLLDLFPPGQETKPVEETAAAASTAPQAASVSDDSREEKQSEASSGSPEKEQIDAAQHKVKVDKLLGLCQKKMQEEVSSLLGADVKFINIHNKIINKEEFFFDEVAGKQVIANLDVVGDLEGQSYLAIDLRDAIRVGGTLIMLPAGELESVVADEDFGEDAADAYGEIANIISGVYTAVFEEQYTKNIRFIRKDLQQVAPMKIEVESDEPIPDENYYLSSMVLDIGGSQYGKINLLFPLTLLQLEGLLAVNEPGAEELSSETVTSADNGTDALQRSQKVTGERESLDILIVGDDEATAATIASTVLDLGYRVKKLSFKDNIHDYVPGELKAVYLVMHEVNEQVFGTVIKISAACNLPLVAAGPGWTRSKVIKAVKYGVRDILLTPASAEQIKENINNNLLDMAA